jgi:hypothetical protein
MDDWDTLARTLRSLHSVLLRRVRADYIQERGLRDEEVGPGELLMLATRDDNFAWLRSLSELMTEIDELRDSADAKQDDRVRAAVRATLEGLLAAPPDSGEGTPFQANYWRHVHGDPEVTIAHAAIRQALRSWPEDGAGRAALDSHLETARRPRT